MWRGLVVVAAVAVFVSSAQGTFYQYYGDRTGITMRYESIAEENEEGMALYNAPSTSVSGDTLLFPSLSFTSSSSNEDSDITDGTLMGWITAKENRAIQSISFEEEGDVTLSGLGTEAYASVANAIYIQIYELDGVPVTPFSLPTINMVMTPSDGDWYISEDGRFTAKPWSGTLLVNLTEELGKLGKTGLATKVYFEMDNTLTTGTLSGTSAFIKKKTTDGLKVTASEEVPEPMTVLLMGLGLGLLRVRRG